MTVRTETATDGAQPLWPVGLVLVATGCYQLGASFGKMLFPAIGAQGATALRLTLSALIVTAVVRPWRGGIDRAAVPSVLAYGVALAGLNACFFLALRTIPLGIAVAIDFMGPLGVAVAYSRRAVDLAWVATAVAGVLLLMPLSVDAATLDPLGLAYCAGSAVCWASYILCGRSAARRLSSGRVTALGLSLAALIVLPFGIAEAGAGLLSPAVLPFGLMVAIFSSALPNSLEMIALPRLPPRLFGVLMSVEPAVGAVVGWTVLGEHLVPREILAVALIVLASGGATLTSARPIPPVDG